ncbi:MAG: hypothetical protein IPL43_08425 [Micropruina sp.]|nr:hypothetical protein [Micropruina sp.]
MAAGLVTMHDIATLARVERPVVSTWRRRYRTSARPFPRPRSRHDNQELFARDEVVSWLEETHRGNNADPRKESTSGAVLSDPRLTDPRNVDALSALLGLRGLLGSPLTGLETDALLDAADALDPDDTLLLGELERAADVTWLADAAEQLVAASWSVTDAHDRLLAARPPVAAARALLSAEAVRLLTALVSPLLDDLGAEAALLDATGCRFDLIPELASATDAPVVLLGGNTRSHRLNRRRLRLAQVIPALISAEAGWSVTGPTLNLAVLPAPGHAAASEASQLSRIDDAALQLTPSQALLALAPAAVLTDPLAGEAGRRRDHLLRAGQVRAVVRLPAGLLPGRVRESMGLWLVTAADAAAPAERRTMVGDLSRRPLTPADVDGLASDVLAARQGVEGVRRRAWAHLHPVLTASLLAGGGSLVPPRWRQGARSRQLRSGADWVVSLSEGSQAHLPSYQLAVAPGRPESVSVGQAEQRGWLRVLTGRRSDPSGLVSEAPTAPVRVWDADALAGPATERLVDRLALHQQLDPVFTEPGDVLFLARPRPAATLDAEGGGAVFAPVRILRVRSGAPLVPAALARRISTQTSTDWRTWELATHAEPGALGDALAELAAERQRLSTQLADLDRFTIDLTEAAESGQLSLTKKENHGPSAS